MSQGRPFDSTQAIVTLVRQLTRGSFEGYGVGRCVGCLNDRFVGRGVGFGVGRLVGRGVGRLVERFVGRGVGL